MSSSYERDDRSAGVEVRSRRVIGAVVAALAVAVVGTAAPAASAAVPPAGAPVVVRTSPDGRFQLRQHTSGDVVVHAPGGAALWSTGTRGHLGARLVLQADGNLVVRSRAGAALWQSRTARTPGARLSLHNDGNLVLTTSTGSVRWASGSHVAAVRMGVLAPGAECGAAPCETSPADRAEVRRLLNLERTRRGLPALRQHPGLNLKADRAARALRSSCRLAHSDLAVGAPPEWRALAENVGVGTTIAQVHAGYMGSTAHVVNVLSPVHDYVGTAAVRGRCGSWDLVFTVQVFMGV